MESEGPRELVQRFIDGRATNDFAVAASALAEDVVWELPKSVSEPLKGRDAVANSLTGKSLIQVLLDLASVQRHTNKIIVEGDTAVLLESMTCRTKAGVDYDNDYAWVFTTRDGAIVHIKEFGDTLRGAQAEIVPGWRVVPAE